MVIAKFRKKGTIKDKTDECSEARGKGSKKYF